jgi:DNA primase
MFSSSVIQELKAATRIEEVVGDFLILRRKGSSLMGLCPFHSERTPSFSVHPARNIFCCFGCGKKGDSITFLQEHGALSFSEALKYLGIKYGIELPQMVQSPAEVVQYQENEAMHLINEFAQKYYNHILGNSPQGKTIAEPYIQLRGITEASIQKFGLGFAIGSNDLYKIFEKRGYSLKTVIDLGLYNDQHQCDFFRSRLIFPIHSITGKVIAFAGRILDRVGEGQFGKYINSKESTVYQKSKTLYGIFQARSAIRKHDNCIVVEGYLDVISLHQAGIENVVATCGTALSLEQLKIIHRNTSNLTILYDADSAGVKAAIRAIPIALEQGINLSICLLPCNEDPDSFVRKYGATQMLEYIEQQSQDFIAFLLGQLEGFKSGASNALRATAIKEVIGLIALISDIISRSAYIQNFAQQIKINEDTITQAVTQVLVQKMSTKNYDNGKKPNIDLTELPILTFQSRTENTEKALISMLIRSGSNHLPSENSLVAQYLLKDFDNVGEMFDNLVFRQIATEYFDLLENGSLFIDQHFNHHQHIDIRRAVVDILSTEHENDLPENQQGNIEQQAKEVLLFFKIEKITALLEKHKQQLSECNSLDEKEFDLKVLVHLKIQETRHRLLQELALHTI